jgi:hypothetical protein
LIVSATIAFLPFRVGVAFLFRGFSFHINPPYQATTRDLFTS